MTVLEYTQNGHQVIQYIIYFLLLSAKSSLFEHNKKM